MKSDFVSTVSHEFRSPLASINQLGEMLRDGIVADEGRRQEYYGMIVTESQRLRRSWRTCSISPGWRTAESSTASKPWIPQNGCARSPTISGAGGPTRVRRRDRHPPGSAPIVVDRENLATAVKNLLDNAVKYSPESRTVRLEAQTNGDGISIAVRDPRHRHRRRGSAAHLRQVLSWAGELSREIKGVGLGLTLVHQIVSAHEGTIDVESRQGKAAPSRFA
jgi:signal transduction histidine kinase